MRCSAVPSTCPSLRAKAASGQTVMTLRGAALIATLQFFEQAPAPITYGESQPTGSVLEPPERLEAEHLFEECYRVWGSFQPYRYQLLRHFFQRLP